MYNILLVDDEGDVLRARSSFLESKGAEVASARTAAEARALAGNIRYDCILLDVMLKDISGFKLCEELQEITDAPIVFLSTLTDIESQMEGFSRGGIDYIAKDCDLELFWLKVKARAEGSQKSRNEMLLCFPPLCIDRKIHRVYIDEMELLLTNMEYEILTLMASRPCYIWNIREIYQNVWGYDTRDSGKTLQPHISRLRRKIEEAFPRHYFLETVWGKGYRFVPMDDYGDY